MSQKHSTVHASPGCVGWNRQDRSTRTRTRICKYEADLRRWLLLVAEVGTGCCRGVCLFLLPLRRSAVCCRQVLGTQGCCPRALRSGAYVAPYTLLREARQRLPPGYASATARPRPRGGLVVVTAGELASVAEPCSWDRTTAGSCGRCSPIRRVAPCRRFAAVPPPCGTELAAQSSSAVFKRLSLKQEAAGGGQVPR